MRKSSLPQFARRPNYRLNASEDRDISCRADDLRAVDRRQDQRSDSRSDMTRVESRARRRRESSASASEVHRRWKATERNVTTHQINKCQILQKQNSI